MSQTMTHKNGTTDYLADFRTDKRMLLLTALALPIGAISALVAKALISGASGLPMIAL